MQCTYRKQDQSVCGERATIETMIASKTADGRVLKQTEERCDTHAVKDMHEWVLNRTTNIAVAFRWLL